MKTIFRSIFMLAVTLSLVLNAYAAKADTLNLVEPISPPSVVSSLVSVDGTQTCKEGLILQSNGDCCPVGTSNAFWAAACIPDGIIKEQIFAGVGETTQYCPTPDLFIVSDKNGVWFSCASSDSTVFYPEAKNFEGSVFCRSHGYASLIKIQPWGTAGCIKYGDSMGDGCIEAGTCSFP